MRLDFLKPCLLKLMVDARFGFRIELAVESACKVLLELMFRHHSVVPSDLVSKKLVALELLGWVHQRIFIRRTSKNSFLCNSKIESAVAQSRLLSFGQSVDDFRFKDT